MGNKFTRWLFEHRGEMHVPWSEIANDKLPTFYVVEDREQRFVAVMMATAKEETRTARSWRSKTHIGYLFSVIKANNYAKNYNDYVFNVYKSEQDLKPQVDPDRSPGREDPGNGWYKQETRAVDLELILGLEQRLW